MGQGSTQTGDRRAPPVDERLEERARNSGTGT